MMIPWLRPVVTAAAVLLSLGGCGDGFATDGELRAVDPPAAAETPAAEAPAGEGPGPAEAASAPLPPDPQASSSAAPAAEEQFSSLPFREHQLAASGGMPFDHLGGSIAAGDGVVVAGARLADGAGMDSGAACVFRRGPEGWRQEARLAPADAMEHDRFGNAVALAGDTLVVGAHAHAELGRKAGAAYVFRYQRGGWRQEAHLAVEGSARFGHAVAVSGDRVAVGAPGDLVGELAAGAVYVFRRKGSTWQREARLTASDGDAGDLFGLAVGLSGEVLAAGASGDDDRGSLTGAAYVFRRGDAGWAEEAKLTAADAAALAEFGAVLAVRGDLIAVGAHGAGSITAPGAARSSKFVGAAYVFRRQGDRWHQEAALLAADRRPGDRFGDAIATDGETVAVGAHFADPAGLGSGAAYLFRRGQGSWRQVAKLLPAGAEAGDEFGKAVAVAGEMIAVGALRGSGEARSAGSVFVFEAGSPQP